MLIKIWSNSSFYGKSRKKQAASWSSQLAVLQRLNNQIYALFSYYNTWLLALMSTSTPVALHIILKSCISLSSSLLSASMTRVSS